MVQPTESISSSARYSPQKYVYEMDDKSYKLAKNHDDIQRKDLKLFSMVSHKLPDLPSTHYLNAII